MPLAPVDFDEPHPNNNIPTRHPERGWLDLDDCDHSIPILESERASYETVGEAYCERCGQYRRISGYRALGEAKK